MKQPRPKAEQPFADRRNGGHRDARRGSGVGRTLFSVLAIALLSGCPPTDPPNFAPGESNRPRVESRGPSSEAPPAERWTEIDKVGSFRVVRADFASAGHFSGRWTADILVNDLAAPGYLALGPASVLPSGSVVVERLRAGGEPGPLFVMSKSSAAADAGAGGAWSFFAVKPDGTKLPAEDPNACARCHADGNGDSLFGVR